jgi:quercetin dioxygenase-like cupin family protein
MDEPFKAEVKELIKYQEGAVVSRTLIDKKEGTVTVFSFDEGQGLSEHISPYDAMAHIIEGAAVLTINGVDHEMKEGELLIMPANRPHAVRATGPFKMLLTMIRK